MCRQTELFESVSGTSDKLARWADKLARWAVQTINELVTSTVLHTTRIHNERLVDRCRRRSSLLYKALVRQQHPLWEHQDMYLYTCTCRYHPWRNVSIALGLDVLSTTEAVGTSFRTVLARGDWSVDFVGAWFGSKSSSCQHRKE